MTGLLSVAGYLHTDSAKRILGQDKPLEGRALQFDKAWRAIVADNNLSRARRQLSIHELRTLINHCLDVAAEPAK
jgi:hypothetical protein